MEDEREEKFSLNLKGEGISIEKEVDKRTALAIVAAVMGGNGVPVAGTAAYPSERSSFNPAKSLREFLIETAPTTNNERIATIGFFLHEHKSKETFSKDDIEAGFRSAREQLPKNLRRDLGRAVGAGWIEEVGQKGHYHVTNTGAKAVQSCFGRQRQPITQ